MADSSCLLLRSISQGAAETNHLRVASQSLKESRPTSEHEYNCTYDTMLPQAIVNSVSPHKTMTTISSRATTWLPQKGSDTTLGFRYRTAFGMAVEGGSGPTGQRTMAGETKKKHARTAAAQT